MLPHHSIDAEMHSVFLCVIIELGPRRYPEKLVCLFLLSSLKLLVKWLLSVQLAGKRNE